MDVRSIQRCLDSRHAANLCVWDSGIVLDQNSSRVLCYHTGKDSPFIVVSISFYKGAKMLKGTLMYLAHNDAMRNFVIHNQATRAVSRRFVAGEVIDDAIEATRAI